MTQPAFGRRFSAEPHLDPSRARPLATGVQAAPRPVSLAPDPATAAMEEELRQWKQDWNRRRLARFKTARWIGGASGVAALACQFLLPDPIGDGLSTVLGIVSFGAFIAGFGRKREPPAG